MQFLEDESFCVQCGTLLTDYDLEDPEQIYCDPCFLEETDREDSFLDELIDFGGEG